MIVGVTLPSGPVALEPDAIAGLGEHAEAAGLGSVWMPDHLIVPHSSAETYPYASQQGAALSSGHAFLDPLIALAAVAGRTQRILLCTGVYLLPLRHPLSNAKAVASLDRLSSGRVRLGVGLGWIREEYEAVGLPWNKRGRMLDEQIDMLRELWRSSSPSFAGSFWSVDSIGFEPKPMDRTVPILIGGMNDAARQRAARRGDGWHLIDVTPAVARDHAAALAADCAACERDPAEVPISIYLSLFPPDAPQDPIFPMSGSAEKLAETLRAYRDAGVAHVALAPRGATSVDDCKRRIDHIATTLMPEVA